jgi:hypothetical protein
MHKRILRAVGSAHIVMPGTPNVGPFRGCYSRSKYVNRVRHFSFSTIKKGAMLVQGSFLKFGAGSGSRTRTPLRAYAPETYASTNSAIPAVHLLCCFKSGRKDRGQFRFGKCFFYLLKIFFYQNRDPTFVP